MKKRTTSRDYPRTARLNTLVREIIAEELEREAMDGLAAFAEMGQPTGYESAEGFDAFVQRVRVENGTMYRVRVGPIAARDAAATLAERVGRETGERAVVVPHP